MDARLSYAALLAAIVTSLGASHRTRNFAVTAPTAEFARSVAESAETNRRDLAIEWLGKELSAWRAPCPIRVTVGPHLGAGGATSFMFDQGRPYGWTMSIQGSRERILDSVLPHEVTHMVFATHFGRRLPRWADEGACTTVEHPSERTKQHRLLIEFLTTNRGIAFNRMFAMKEYPRDILPLYAQGYSLARFLIAQGGKRQFVRYVGDGLKQNDWTTATRDHYGFSNLSELQVTWLDWVRRGSPNISAGTSLARANQNKNGPANRAGPLSVVPVSATTTLGNRQGLTTDVSEDSNEGWYARQRDKAQRATTRGDSRGSASRNGAVQPDVRSVTRPQPVGRPQQVILRKSRIPNH